MVARKSATRKQTEITSAVVFRCTDKAGNILGYGVPSDSTSEVYQVTYNKGEHRYECNCPCGIARHHTVECKHIKAVKSHVAARRELLVSYEVEQVQEQPLLVATAVVTIEDAMDVAQTRMSIHIDQVAAQAEALNMQKLASHKIADAYEQLAQPKCCPRCGESDLLYPRTGRCQWVSDYSQL